VGLPVFKTGAGRSAPSRVGSTPIHSRRLKPGRRPDRACFAGSLRSFGSSRLRSIRAKALSGFTTSPITTLTLSRIPGSWPSTFSGTFSCPGSVNFWSQARGSGTCWGRRTPWQIPAGPHFRAVYPGPLSLPGRRSPEPGQPGSAGYGPGVPASPDPAVRPRKAAARPALRP
jgi:hypothetical protein